MTVAPDVAALLADEALLGLPALSSLSPAAARAQDAWLQQRRRAGSAVPQVSSAEDTTLAGVPARVVTPLGDGPPPVVLHVHGGGWVLGSPETYLLVVRRLATGVGAVVVDIDYRLAPEHPFPAGLDDCWAVLQEVAAWGRPVAVAGDSGGAAIAAALTFRARDAGLRLAGQLLVYPSVSLVQAWPSWRQFRSGAGLDAADSRWFADCWVPRIADRGRPLVSPYEVASLVGVPPAVVAVAEVDPLRDGGLAYAERLRADGVATTVVIATGQVHGYLTMPGLVGAERAVVAAHAALRTLLR